MRSKKNRIKRRTILRNKKPILRNKKPTSRNKKTILRNKKSSSMKGGKYKWRKPKSRRRKKTQMVIRRMRGGAESELDKIPQIVEFAKESSGWNKTLVENLYPDWNNDLGDSRVNYWWFRRILVDALILKACKDVENESQIKPKPKVKVTINGVTIEKAYAPLIGDQKLKLVPPITINIPKQLQGIIDGEDAGAEEGEGDDTMDILAMGSNDLTSDYDISLALPSNKDVSDFSINVYIKFLGYLEELVILSELGVEARKLLPQLVNPAVNTRVCFDTNLYPHPILFPTSYIGDNPYFIQIHGTENYIPCPTKVQGEIIPIGSGRTDLDYFLADAFRYARDIKQISKEISRKEINDEPPLLKIFSDPPSDELYKTKISETINSTLNERIPLEKIEINRIHSSTKEINALFIAELKKIEALPDAEKATFKTVNIKAIIEEEYDIFDLSKYNLSTYQRELINANLQLLKCYRFLYPVNTQPPFITNPNMEITAERQREVIRNYINFNSEDKEKFFPKLYLLQYVKLCNFCYKKREEGETLGATRVASRDRSSPVKSQVEFCYFTQENIANWNKIPQCKMKEATEMNLPRKQELEKGLQHIYTNLLADEEKGMYNQKNLYFRSQKKIDDYFKNIHKVLFTSVETYYTISSVLHVVFLLQSNSSILKLNCPKINIYLLKQMLFVSAIEQLGFIMYEFFLYKPDLPKCIKKSAKYIARLSHAIALAKNERILSELISDGINKADFINLGDHDLIIKKYKKGEIPPKVTPTYAQVAAPKSEIFKFLENNIKIGGTEVSGTNDPLTFTPEHEKVLNLLGIQPLMAEGPIPISDNDFQKNLLLFCLYQICDNFNGCVGDIFS